MNRHYDVAQYMELIHYAKEKIPGVTFSSDIIVGFPGETEEDFEATLELIRKVGYMQLFTFIYSKRTGTPAASTSTRTVCPAMAAVAAKANSSCVFSRRSIRAVFSAWVVGSGSLAARVSVRLE